jgi:hypothetical protein
MNYIIFMNRISRIFTYTNTTTNGNLNGSIEFGSTSLNFLTNSVRKIRLIDVNISSSIPNVYSGNNIINVSNDNGSTYETIELDTGVYTVALLNSAINNVINNQLEWSTADDPVFQIKYNTATMKCYIEIDDSKLIAGTNFKIDFYTNSTMYDMLGFEVDTVYSDGITEATNYSKINYQGDVIKIIIMGLGTISYVNGNSTNEICEIGLTNTTDNIYIYPTQSIVLPEINLSCSNTINNIGIKILSSTNNNMIFFDGRVKITFEIIEYV